MKKHIFLILAVIFSTAIVGYAQPQNDKSKLEQERKNLQAELKEVQAQYDKVKSQTKQSLGQLSILKRKIDLQEQYLSNINKEIKNIDDDDLFTYGLLNADALLKDKKAQVAFAQRFEAYKMNLKISPKERAFTERLVNALKESKSVEEYQKLIEDSILQPKNALLKEATGIESLEGVKYRDDESLLVKTDEEAMQASIAAEA